MYTQIRDLVLYKEHCHAQKWNRFCYFQTWQNFPKQFCGVTQKGKEDELRAKDRAHLVSYSCRPIESHLLQDARLHLTCSLVFDVVALAMFYQLKKRFFIFVNLQKLPLSDLTSFLYVSSVFSNSLSFFSISALVRDLQKYDNVENT